MIKVAATFKKVMRRITFLKLLACSYRIALHDYNENSPGKYSSKMIFGANGNATVNSVVSLLRGAGFWIGKGRISEAVTTWTPGLLVANRGCNMEKEFFVNVNFRDIIFNF